MAGQARLALKAAADRAESLYAHEQAIELFRTRIEEIEEIVRAAQRAADLTSRLLVFGRPDAGVDMTFDFGRLIAHAARTRPLCAGTIIGSGTVSNKLDGGPGKSVDEGGVGYSCIAEIRMIETIQSGKPQTEFLKFGDRVRIEMRDGDGLSIFGAIDHEVQQY